MVILFYTDYHNHGYAYENKILHNLPSVSPHPYRL